MIVYARRQKADYVRVNLITAVLEFRCNAKRLNTSTIFQKF
jgi:hypothetical protein